MTLGDCGRSQLPGGSTEPQSYLTLGATGDGARLQTELWQLGRMGGHPEVALGLAVVTPVGSRL